MPALYRSTLIVLALGASVANPACNATTSSSPVNSDQFVEFKSAAGNSFVAPSQWTTVDEGNVWYLSSPDSAAAITVFTFTVEGSGSLDDMANLMISEALPGKAGDWHETRRSTAALDQTTAKVIHFVDQPDEPTQRFQIYVLRTGKFYHSICLSISEQAAALNGDFYESVVVTFKGAE